MKYYSSFALLSTFSWAGAAPSVSQPTADKNSARKLDGGTPPNIIFLLVDDWGSGDADICPDDVELKYCPFRSTTDARKSVLHTPMIKKMAEEGQIMTNFYSPRAICTPSRAGIMMGRDASRYGMVDNLFRILQTSSGRGGLPTSEKSVAKYLKEAGYSTGYTGKWHMGASNGTSLSAHTPINHGFDFVKFFIEGSNGEACPEGALNPPDDNNIYHMCSFDHVQDCDPVTKECEVVEQPIRWENVTNRQLRTFKEFIDLHKDDGKPFFYNHAFPHVHVPWVPSRFFVTDPSLKHWTDMVGEVDWAVGYILDYLNKTGLADNTMVVLSSDNGPYLESASTWCPQNCIFQTPSAEKEDTPEAFGCTVCSPDTVSKTSLDQGGKGSTWEGGQHVPTVVWWPNHVKPGTINPMVASGLDLLPTFVSIAGGTLDAGVDYDGKDISEALLATSIDKTAVPEGNFVYWCGLQINAVRTGRYKTIFYSQRFYANDFDLPTPKFMCAGTGECCADGPTRLCSCFGSDKQTVPVLIDLIENPHEDFSEKLNYIGTDLEAVVTEAEDIAKATLMSVLEDRNLEPTGTVEEMTARLGGVPAFPQVDYCVPAAASVINFGPYECNGVFYPQFKPDVGAACDWMPEECQQYVFPGMSDPFYPMQNCSIQGTYQSSECAQRLPCCKGEEEDGYNGPFEYIKPVNFPDGESIGWSGETYTCGCYRNGENSYFPDDTEMQLSVCAWQDTVLEKLNATGLNIWTTKNPGFCRLPVCLGGDEDKLKKNAKICDGIKKYGLTSVPTGDIFNAPYPDTQEQDAPSSLLYPNQEYAPGDCKNGNGNGKNCKGKGKEKGKGKGKGKEKGNSDGNANRYSNSNSNSVIHDPLVKDKPNSSMVTTTNLVWALVSVTMFLYAIKG